MLKILFAGFHGLSPFHCNSLFRCALQPNIAINFAGSRLFNVIDVDKPKKLVTSASYDKQHVSAYLQQFSC